MIYYDSRCPQCREDDEKQQFDKMIEPVRKAERRKEAQKQLSLILAKLGKSTLVREATRYKQSVCPYCGHSSLFFSEATGYECHNKDCGLTSSIRYYIENSDR